MHLPSNFIENLSLLKFITLINFSYFTSVIARIKGENPEMPHIEAFTLAAKLWKEKTSKPPDGASNGESKKEESESKGEPESESKNEEITIEAPTGEEPVAGESSV